MNVLITSGPTREWMDPVRYLTNPSSGAMGRAMAAAFLNKKFRVTVVSGPVALTYPKKARVISVESGLQMASVVKRLIRKTDVFVATAAVGDWRFEKIATQKMKKNVKPSINLKLVRNPDILAAAARRGGKRPRIVIGFSLETNDVTRHAVKKLRHKNLDLIIANTPASFGSPALRPVWVDAAGAVKKLPVMKKTALARVIAIWAERRLRKE